MHTSIKWDAHQHQMGCSFEVYAVQHIDSEAEQHVQHPNDDCHLHLQTVGEVKVVSGYTPGRVDPDWIHTITCPGEGVAWLSFNRVTAAEYRLMERNSL